MKSANVNGANYFVLADAHDSENLADMVVFTDSADVASRADGFFGTNGLYVAPKKFFENIFVKGNYSNMPDDHPDNAITFGKYRHYKGKEYEVVGLAFHVISTQHMVVYKALYDDESFGKNSLWVRPKKMFFEDVDIPELHYKGPRFTFTGFPPSH
jgi:hypothetical protein